MKATSLTFKTVWPTMHNRLASSSRVFLMLLMEGCPLRWWWSSAGKWIGSGPAAEEVKEPFTQNLGVASA